MKEILLINKQCRDTKPVTWKKLKLEPYVAPETADGLKYCFKTYTNTVRKH